MAAHIEDLLEDRARAGDSSAAIAMAIFALADAQRKTATALDRLGLNGADTSLGAIELLAGEIEELGNRLSPS